jgi:hypothetical protein
MKKSLPCIWMLFFKSHKLYLLEKGFGRGTEKKKIRVREEKGTTVSDKLQQDQGTRLGSGVVLHFLCLKSSVSTGV